MAKLTTCALGLGFSLGLGVAASMPAQAQGSAQIEFDRTTIGDWVVECLPDQSGPGVCQLYQRVLTNEANVVAMVVTFVWSTERESLQTQIAMPLGVLLSFAPELKIGESYATTLAWSRCISDGCLIEGFTNPETLTLLGQSDRASISVRHPMEGVIAIPVSLGGFKEALAQIVPASVMDALPE